MKRILILILICAISTFANIFNEINTFSAYFEQTITNEHSKSVVYKGVLFIKKPYYSKWDYKYPIKKTIYISKNKLALFDKELEQVTLATLKNQLNFIKLLRNAKKIKKNYYKATYSNTVFKIFIKKSNIYKIKYKDELNNQVVIIFKNQKNNIEISDKTFKYSIPRGYDIIR